MKLKNKTKAYLNWYDENIHELFMSYGEYVESMIESSELSMIENVTEWLDEEWNIYNETK